MTKKISNLHIDVNMDTDSLSLKLKAIAKHATALANELERIDADELDKCKKCGGHVYTEKTFKDYKLVSEIRRCNDCLGEVAVK